DQPVSSAIYIIKSGETIPKLISESVSEFTTLPNGDIRVYKTLEQRFNAPASTYTIYQGPGNPSNPEYIETQSLMYNNANELAGIYDEGNRAIINIYDYNSKYIVATVVNSDALANKSAYTSFETLSLGGWWISSGVAAYDHTIAITGNSSFILSPSNALTTSITTNRDHIISYWSNGSVTVPEGTLPKSEPEINKFTYYEYEIAAG